MDGVDDRLLLNSAVLGNLVDGQWFLPFTVYRLHSYALARQLIMTVKLERVLSRQTVIRRLLLSWEANTPVLSSPPVQESVITEWAACGIACAILPFYTKLQLVKITESGDRFDYWVGDGQQLYGLEVSGILQGQIAQRQRAKTRNYWLTLLVWQGIPVSFILVNKVSTFLFI